MLCLLCEESYYCPTHDPEMYAWDVQNNDVDHGCTCTYAVDGNWGIIAVDDDCLLHGKYTDESE